MRLATAIPASFAALGLALAGGGIAAGAASSDSSAPGEHRMGGSGMSHQDMRDMHRSMMRDPEMRAMHRSIMRDPEMRRMHKHMMSMGGRMDGSSMHHAR
jgi:flagellar biosynthesis protein FlhB